MDWAAVIAGQQCPFLRRKCLKSRKSAPEVTIGSCTVAVGKQAAPVMICPFRLLERNQVFMDCIHLLTLHEPGNELHIVPELAVPGGSIDYCLVSVKDRNPVDFVGIELQTLDTTGTVWPERQRFAHQHGISVKRADRTSPKLFALNNEGKFRLQLAERLSTDGMGIAKCLGLQGEAKVELEEILQQLEAKISSQTLMSVEQPPPAASLIDEASDDES